MQLQELTFFQPYCVYYGVFTASMVSFAAGVAVNWAATILPHLQSNDTSINPLPEPPTILESSWIVSIIMIGCITGPCIGGILTAKLGKKKTILLVGIPVCIGHLIIAFATTVWAFLIARFAFGLTLGCSFGLMASYVGDIAEDHNRGLLGSFPTLFMSIGGLYVYTVGPFTSVKLFSLLNLIPIVLVFMFFGLFVPDTPFDLLQYNSVEEARKSLAFYRASMVSFAAGVAVNWAATILPHLQSNDTSINPLPEPPTILESSWIVSIIMIGCITGPCIGGILTAKLGKKKTILLVGIPVCIGHLIIAFATTVWAFLIARFAFGLTLGCSFGLMASYVGDIAEDHNRGLLGSFPTLFMSIGGLYVYTVGPFTSVKLFSLLNLIPIVLVFMFFGLFVPDTPFDLLQYNSVEEARKSLAFYRGKTLIEIDTDFKILQDTLKSRDNIQTKKSTNAIEQLRSIYKSKPLFRGLKMVEAVFILQGLSGMGAVASYYQTIFDESSGSLDSIYSVMIIGVVTLFSTIITSQLVERLGRRVLLLVSFLLMGLSLFSLATYFLLKSRDHNIDSISWLPLVSLIVYTISYNAQGGIPWILLTDIFPSDVLDICTTITSITMFSLVFVISLVFPYLRELLGNYGAFYIFGCCMACAVVFTFLIVPETKGRSIEEVQGILAEKNCL